MPDPGNDRIYWLVHLVPHFAQAFFPPSPKDHQVRRHQLSPLVRNSNRVNDYEERVPVWYGAGTLERLWTHVGLNKGQHVVVRPLGNRNCLIPTSTAGAHTSYKECRALV